MGKAYCVSLVFAFIVGLFSGCYYHEPVSVHGSVGVPVVLYFPDEETKEIYEETYRDDIEEANNQFDFITFYVVDVVVRDYELEFVYKETDPDQYLKNNVISIYAVLEISYEDKSYEGIALRGVNCERFAALIYPVENRLIMSHELGHLTGLDHVKDENNIMHPNNIPEDAELTDIQKALAHQQAGHYAFFCPLN